MKHLDKKRWSGIFISIFGLVCMIFGVYRGEMAVVLQKAVNICLECIGIG